MADGDRPDVHHEETTRVVQGWPAGVLSSSARLPARAGRAPGATVHLMETTPFTGTDPLSDATDQRSGWPQR